MSVGFLSLNAALDARVRAVLPAGIDLATGYAPEDLTDPAAPILARIVPHGVYPREQRGKAGLLEAHYSFFVEFDQERIDATQEAAGYAFFDDAMAQICGWAYAPGRMAEFQQSPAPMAYDGRIGRVEFSFVVPVIVTGNP